MRDHHKNQERELYSIQRILMFILSLEEIDQDTDELNITPISIRATKRTPSHTPNHRVKCENFDRSYGSIFWTWFNTIYEFYSRALIEM